MISRQLCSTLYSCCQPGRCISAVVHPTLHLSSNQR